MISRREENNMLKEYEISQELNRLKIERLNTHPEDDKAIEEIWGKEVEILSRDKEATYNFIRNFALMDDFENIAEIIEELCKKFNDRKFIDLLYEYEEKAHERFRATIRKYGEPLIEE